MQIYLLLTDNCNLNCSYCIRGEKGRKYLPFNEVESIFKANNFVHDQLLITGGEPTIHPSFEDIVNLGLKYFKNVSINTNGTINRFNNFRPTSNLHIQISLDGFQKTHELIRGENTFCKTINNIYKIEKYCLPYNVSSVINKCNMKQIIKLVSFLETLKMEYWKVEPQLPFGCGKPEMCISIQNWNNLVDTLINICPFRLKVKKLFDFSLLDSLSDNKLVELGKSKMKNCGNCTRKIYIYPDWNVYPCTCLTDFCLGNLQNNTLDEILQTNAALMFSQYKVLPESTCFSCKYLPLCNGGCIGISYANYKILGMGDIRCPLISKN